MAIEPSDFGQREPGIIIDLPRGESLSSVEVKTTAKGEAQWAVKVYEGADPTELDRLADEALRIHFRLREALFG